MTDEAKQQKFYFVTTALPGPADECVFIDVQTEDGKDAGPEGTGADWEEHPSGHGHGHGLYRLGPFARYGEHTPETEEESDARFDEWWTKNRLKGDEQWTAWYDEWTMKTTGTESEVYTLSSIIEGARKDIANKVGEWQTMQAQLPAMEAAVGLVHPGTGDPLVKMVGGKRGSGFNGYMVLLTEDDHAVEGWWGEDAGVWKLSGGMAPDGWKPMGSSPDQRQR